MRPLFHYTVNTGWINDPHGITFKDGKYHAFYQYVPGQTSWAPSCHWGHAVGHDLFSLRELPFALGPGDGDDGIWTGSLVLDENSQPLIFYTSINTPDFSIGKVRVASTKDANWEVWSKGQVVAEAPDGLDLIAFRDPFIRRDSECWRMFLGAGDRDGRAMALSYTSTDLQEWAYEGVVLQRSNLERSDVWMGSLWECPQFVTIDSQDLMISSIWDADQLYYSAFAAGTYETGKFTPNSWGRFTFGDCYYAPSYFLDSQNRPSLQLWLRGISNDGEGWAGAHSIPYLLHWREGQILALPHTDIDKYQVPIIGDEIPSLACDIEWDSSHGSLEIYSAGRRLVSLVRNQEGNLRIDVDGKSSELAFSGNLRIILDGPILEISGLGGLFAAIVNPAGNSLNLTSGAEGLVHAFGIEIPEVS